MSEVKVKVPATTANLGPGFDCLGAALTLYNQFIFTSLASDELLKIIVVGRESEKLSCDRHNLIYQSFLRLYERIEIEPPPVEITIHLNVPLARGLGSSATAIVGGLMGANSLAGNPLSKEEIMQLAIAIEGHPDNVVPALLGNCQLSIKEADSWSICPLPWHQELTPVVAIPNFELSTEAARSVLPTDISRQDAIYNIAHLGLLIKGLEHNRGDWLSVAMADKLHQPYRQKLITGYQAIQAAAVNAGAYGLVISGAGPTLLALAHANKAEAVAKAMERAWQQMEVEAIARVLKIDAVGATVV